MKNIIMDISDLEKLERAVQNAYDYHWAQNTMNSRLHLSERVIASPLTSELHDALRRIRLLREQSKLTTPTNGADEG